MSTVRIGLIGYGGMGAHHAQYITSGEVKGGELVAVCEAVPERLKVAKEKHGEKVQYFSNPDELFAAKCVDGILIATPHYEHPVLAIKGFENDLHVLSEKPAGVCTKHVREMNEKAKASGKVFSLMFQQRTVDAYRKLRELVSSGDLGEIRRTNWIITNWFRSQAYYDSGGWRATWAGEGGGVLLNQCPHNLDLWQWIAGMPKRVRAFCYFGKYHKIEVEDDVTAFMEYPNGATGTFVTTTGEAPGTNRLEITGDRGKVVLEHGKLTFWRTRTPVSQFLKETKESFATPELWTCEIPTGSDSSGHKTITQGWVDAIAKETPLVAPGEEGIRSVELANAMLLSAWTDSWVELPIDDDKFHAELKKRVEDSTFKKPEGGKAVDVAGSFNM
jgi:predicted dehydrogenase